MLCSAEVTCNQHSVINGPVICTWLLNKQKSHSPPQSLESYPTEWHFEHHQWYNWLILGPERQKSLSEESLISFLWAKHYYSLNHAVQWIIITAQFNWTYCCRGCQPVFSIDLFMSYKRKILRKTYHHSFVLVCVYRPLSIEDYYDLKLVALVWKTNESKSQAQCSAIKMRQCMMSKHFNYCVEYKTKGNSSDAYPACTLLVDLDKSVCQRRENSLYTQNKGEWLFWVPKKQLLYWKWHESGLRKTSENH